MSELWTLIEEEDGYDYYNNLVYMMKTNAAELFGFMSCTLVRFISRG